MKPEKHKLRRYALCLRDPLGLLENLLDAEVPLAAQNADLYRAVLFRQFRLLIHENLIRILEVPSFVLDLKLSDFLALFFLEIVFQGELFVRPWILPRLGPKRQSRKT